jgi:FMN-dependent NADH-azoreductase
MTNILFLTQSPPEDLSEAVGAGRILCELKDKHPGASVVVRDLAQDPPPHGDDEVTVGSDVLIDELVAADILVIAVPAINFSTPATLKSWIDRVMRRGRTFRYEDGRPHGLLTGRKAIIVQAKGGIPSGLLPEPYLQHMLGFLGIADIETVEVEGARPVVTIIDHPEAVGPHIAGRPGPGWHEVSASPHWTPLGAAAARSRPLRAHWPHGGSL